MGCLTGHEMAITQTLAERPGCWNVCCGDFRYLPNLGFYSPFLNHLMYFQIFKMVQEIAVIWIIIDRKKILRRLTKKWE